MNNSLLYELQLLLDDGYDIEFSKGEHGYVVSVDKDSDAACTAIADTAWGALWAASPLHPEDEPCPTDDKAQVIWDAIYEAGFRRRAASVTDR